MVGARPQMADVISRFPQRVTRDWSTSALMPAVDCGRQCLHFLLLGDDNFALYTVKIFLRFEVQT